MCRKANYMLHTFAPCDPFTKSQLLHSFCLSLYGCSLWFSSSSELKFLEISFNNIIRKIWSLSRRCHTAPLHLVAGIPSIFNTILSRSCKLIQSALKSASPVLVDVFTDCIDLVYTSCGHNLHYGYRFWKNYTDQDILMAKFLFDVKLAPDLNSHLMDDLLFICCV